MEHALNKGAAPAAALDHATPDHVVINTKPKSHTRHADRITINADALAHVNAWVAELEGRRITVSRNQLVNWLLCHHEPTLSPSELRELEAAFFDEVRFAEWALRELKAAQGRGEAVTLAEIIARHRSASRPEKQAGQTKLKQSRIRSEDASKNVTPTTEKLTTDTSAKPQESRIFLDKNGVK